MNDDMKKMLRRVQEATQWRKNANFDGSWAKMIKLYGNRYDYPELGGYQDVIAPNMVFSTVNVIVPSVAVNYPKITVTARNPQDEMRAMVVEAVTNYNWRHFDVHDEFRMAVKDFVIIGHAWCKTSWAFVEAEEDWTPEAWLQEAQQRLMERDQAASQAQSQGMTDIEFPTDRQVFDSIPRKQKVIRQDQPLVERVSPFDVYVDPDATRLKNARWIAQRMYIPLEKAKARKDWNQKVLKGLQGKAMSEAKQDIDLMYDGEDRGSEAEFAVVWEFYDLVNSKVCTFAEGCEDFLAKPDDVPFAFEHPFVMMCNYTVPDKFYPLGDVEVIAGLQMELALTRTQMINDRKRFRRLYLIRQDEVGEDGMAQFRSGDDNVLINIEGDRPFSDVFAPLGTSSLPPEFYNQTAMILDDVNLVSGVTEYQRGSMSEIRRTATEANMIQDGANARSADKLAIVERAIGDVAGRIVALAQQFLTTDQVAKIVGEDGAAQWVPYSREDIAGEYDFEVEAGSTQPQNESFRRQSAMQLMDSMAPFIGSGVVDPRKIAEHVLRNGFGIKNPQEFMMMAPMPGMPPEGGEMPPGGPEGAPEGAPPAV